MKSIAFCPKLVKAIIDRKKTMTRRVMEQQPKIWQDIFDFKDGTYAIVGEDFEGHPFTCPYQPGELRWIREHHWKWGRWVQKEFSTPTGRVGYRFEPVGNQVRFEHPGWTASRNGSLGWVFRNSRYMLESDARAVIKIGDSRAERLQEITEKDAIAEGFDGNYWTASVEFRELWDELNGDRGFNWLSNPFVWVINFELHTLRNHQ